MHLLTAATWADIAAASGTSVLAAATVWMANQTRRLARETNRLVENAQQPVLVPCPTSVPYYDWTPGGPPGGFSQYLLPVRNVGTGVAIVNESGSARLVDPPDALRLAQPGCVIVAPGEEKTIELKGTHDAVPVFKICLTYSDVEGARVNQTEISYDHLPPSPGSHPTRRVRLTALSIDFRVSVPAAQG